MSKRPGNARGGRTTSVRTPSSRTPFLAAALIVRDEAANIGPCLAALRSVVDEIHVHDTGSNDATPQLAAASGAQVSHGPWTDDFAAARNAALDGWSAQWVLTVDADEIVTADVPALRRFLTSTPDALILATVDHRSDRGDLRSLSPRLFRPELVHWERPLHEQLVGRLGPVGSVELPPDILRVTHSGYLSAETRQAKAARNVAVARGALARLAAQSADAPASEVAKTMLDLGRSLYSDGQLQEAVDTFEAVRELFPATAEWLAATDSLCRLVLDNGLEDVALALVLQLRGAGADPRYCDWLEARCLVQTGHHALAADLLAGVTEVVGLRGTREDPARIALLHQQIQDALATTATPSPA
jgi:hypothetical protein